MKFSTIVPLALAATVLARPQPQEAKAVADNRQEMANELENYMQSEEFIAEVGGQGGAGLILTWIDNNVNGITDEAQEPQLARRGGDDDDDYDHHKKSNKHKHKHGHKHEHNHGEHSGKHKHAHHHYHYHLKHKHHGHHHKEHHHHHHKDKGFHHTGKGFDKE